MRRFACPSDSSISLTRVTRYGLALYKNYNSHNNKNNSHNSANIFCLFAFMCGCKFKSCVYPVSVQVSEVIVDCETKSEIDTRCQQLHTRLSAITAENEEVHTKYPILLEHNIQVVIKIASLSILL